MSASTVPRWPLVAVCGKFQPFHNEHLTYVLAAFDLGEHVVVGITNPDPTYVRDEVADPRRSRPESNPATYFERHLMVDRSLGDAGIAGDRYTIVPFPLNVPTSWFSYVPRDAVFLLTLYDDDPWLLERKARLEGHGLITHVLWSRPAKGVVGTEVRRLIAEGGEWRQAVPPAVARVISERGIDARIRAGWVSPPG